MDDRELMYFRPSMPMAITLGFDSLSPPIRLDPWSPAVGNLGSNLVSPSLALGSFCLVCCPAYLDPPAQLVLSLQLCTGVKGNPPAVVK